MLLILQAQQSVKSWLPQARLGIYLGPFPRHTRSVSLVLNLNTGLVSPQFHVKHDEFFEMIDKTKQQSLFPWITLAGFRRPQPTSSPNPVFARDTPLGDTTSPEPQRENSTISVVPTAFEPPTRAAPPLQIAQEPQLPEVRIANHPQPATIPAAIDPAPPPSRRSARGRIRRPTQRLVKSMNQGLQITSYSTYYDVLHEEDFSIQDAMQDPIAFKASGDPDTMYYHQAMAASDKDQFLEAIVKEVNAHIENNHWILVPKSEVPEGTKVLDSIWAMKHKRDIKTQQVYKHKARLNIHGGQQEYGVHYTETYSPVVNWFSVQLIAILSIINGWHTRQIDFVLAYPQAPLPYDNYMKLPRGIKMKTGDSDSHVLKLKQNIYGGRNSGRIWNDYLTKD
jgi:hypothetical protein